MNIIIVILSAVFYFLPGYSSAVTSAKDPEWHATITPFYAEENTGTTVGTKKDNKCAGKNSCVAKVTFVIDGDTISLSTGEKVRYIGVDTPETKHPVKKVECFGGEAFEKNKQLVQGKEVRLEKDVSDRDRYGRLLRYVYLPARQSLGEGGDDDIFINDYLARNGYASAATFPPDVKMSEQFRLAEREARFEGRGLWAPGACAEKSQEILDQKIKDKINLEKKYYRKNHQGFRESLIQDILELTAAPLDRIGFWVYTTLQDVK